MHTEHQGVPSIEIELEIPGTSSHRINWYQDNNDLKQNTAYISSTGGLGRNEWKTGLLKRKGLQCIATLGSFWHDVMFYSFKIET